MTECKPAPAANASGHSPRNIEDHALTPPGVSQDMLRIAAIASALEISPDAALEAFEAPAETQSGLSALADASELIAVFLSLGPRQRREILTDAKARAQAQRSNE